MAPLVILIGGLSRSGKSTMVRLVADGLRRKGVEVLTIPLDHWIVPLEIRKPNSTVLERYRLGDASRDLQLILSGVEVVVTPYDPVSRGLGDANVTFAINRFTQALLIEGVTALAHTRFLELADYCVYVEAKRFTRLRRLVEFYRHTKRMPFCEYRQLIRAREREETPSITATRTLADLVVTEENSEFLQERINTLIERRL